MDCVMWSWYSRSTVEIYILLIALTHYEIVDSQSDMRFVLCMCYVTECLFIAVG